VPKNGEIEKIEKPRNTRLDWTFVFVYICFEAQMIKDRYKDYGSMFFDFIGLVETIYLF
jgi:hypothetical protein